MDSLDSYVDKDGKKPQLVRMFPTDKAKDIGVVKDAPLTFGPPFGHSLQKTVTILNDKTGRWEVCGLVDSLAPCPTCGKMLRVQAIQGTTYLATCSGECSIAWMEKNPGWFGHVTDEMRTRLRMLHEGRLGEGKPQTPML